MGMAPSVTSRCSRKKRARSARSDRTVSSLTKSAMILAAVLWYVGVLMTPYHHGWPPLDGKIILPGRSRPRHPAGSLEPDSTGKSRRAGRFPWVVFFAALRPRDHQPASRCASALVKHNQAELRTSSCERFPGRPLASVGASAEPTESLLKNTP